MKARKSPKPAQSPRHYTLAADHGSYALTGQPVGPVVLTTATLTKAIAPVARDPSKTPERLSAWARHGLLKPLGEQFPGTGSHRIYLEDALPVAAVLTAMADKGEPTTAAETHLPEALARARSGWHQWKAKPGPMFLVVEHWGDQRTKPRIDVGLHVGSWETDKTSATSVDLINLNQIFALIIVPKQE